MADGPSTHGQLLGVLRRTARKLLAARALESAAVQAVAAGLAVAALQLAWLIAPRSRWLALALCAAPAAGGVALALLAAMRRRLALERSASAMASAICILIGLLGGAAVAAGRTAWADEAMLPLAIVPAAALLGAAARAVRGVSIQQAAAFLDARGRLQEQWTTAAELSACGRGDESVAQFTRERALGALPGAAGRLSSWRRGRPTLGAMALVTMLCLALWFLSAQGRAGAVQAGAALQSMTPRQRQDLGEQFRKAARASNDAELAAKLAQAAVAVQVVDEERFRQLLAELRQAVKSSPDRAAAEAARQALLAAAGAKPETGAADGAEGVPTSAKTETPAAHGAAPAPAFVSVFDVLYAPPAAPPNAGSPPPAQAAEVPMQDAWTAARDRAASALQRGDVPARYRQLLRDYFTGDQP